MDTSAKTIQNNILATVAGQAPRHVLNSIQKASAHTGVNFAYLLQQAGVESSFNPTASARTSSAKGLYQFIESTWLSMVKKYGDKHGMGGLAQHIDARGRVDDPSVREQILALRNDPEKSSVLAAEFANENKNFLEKNWGGDVGSTELYFAHFMGAGGAAAFLKARDENPLQEAALLFPDAAKSNRNVFYDARTGRARTMDEVYAFFDKKFDIKDNLPEIAQNALPAAAPAPLEHYRAQDAIQSVLFADNRSAPRPRMIAGTEQMPYAAMTYSSLMADPVEVMILSQLSLPGVASPRYND